jgi:hypothetical protein
MKMSNDLKSCPFCGGKADVYSNPGRRYTWFIYCACEMCGARGKTYATKINPSEHNWNTDDVKCAKRAWNMRFTKVNEEDE